MSYMYDDESGFWVSDRVPFYDGVDWGFSEEGGESALRAATFDKCWSCKKDVDEHDGWCRHCGMRLNPRDLPCPSCHLPNMLTQADRNRGYHCDNCANRVERGQDIDCRARAGTCELCG